MDETTPPPPPPIPEAPAPTPPNSDDKLWILFSHLSIVVGLGLVVPLVIYLVKKPDSALVGDHAREALNFHITVYLVCFVLAITCIGHLLIFPVIVAADILGVMAAIKASDGIFYRYPVCLRLVK